MTHVDNVTAQRRLLREVFGVERLALIYGWSMGAQQALHWGALFPDEVERICALCGTAKTTPHNLAFIGGVKAAMTGDPRWRGKHFDGHPERGLRYGARLCKLGNVAGLLPRGRVSRVRQPGSMRITLFDSGKEISFAATAMTSWPSSALGNSRTSVITILKGDLMQRSQPSLQNGFDARATDMYFTPFDIEDNARGIPAAQCVTIDSPDGHRAGNPTHNHANETFIAQTVASLLADE